MNKKLLLLLILCLNFAFVNAQLTTFPQALVNKSLSIANSQVKKEKATAPVVTNNMQNAFQCINTMERLKNTNWNSYKTQDHSRVLDTIYVGAAITDTLVITGSFFHEGPIFVFNQGVLIIHNASLVNEGDIYVFGNGQLLCDSSSLTFPQQYFYQRGLYAVQQSIVYFFNVSLNYSGLQHHLVVGDSANVAMENVHQDDWTTAGLYGIGSLYIDNMNLGGEYILTESSTSLFKHVDTLLLWHKFPPASVIEHSFPQGDTVYNYYFSNVIPNITGIDYVNYTDSCYTVWWGIMPVNGSDVTLNNSNIHVAGPWFQDADTISVSNIENNTFYPNTLIPLADRTLNMLNTFVQTWSFYVFDSSYVDIDNCTLGEVGTQQKANVVAQDLLLDGSGGYFWATDTSFVYAVNSTCYSTVRSEKSGIFLLAYSEMPFAGPTATYNSLVISAQNNTAIDPIAYDNALAWNQKIDGPSAAQIDSLVPIMGSAWIHQGPGGSWMTFQSYSLFYQMVNTSTWTPIVVDSLQEISHDTLALWNTSGLQVGDYVLKQVTKNSLGDSIETFVNIVLLPSVVSMQSKIESYAINLIPNPAESVAKLNIELSQEDVFKIYLCDINGKLALNVANNLTMKQGKSSININVNELSNGMYFVMIEGQKQMLRAKLTVSHQ